VSDSVEGFWFKMKRRRSLVVFIRGARAVERELRDVA
jgi:hypothetical protein